MKKLLLSLAMVCVFPIIAKAQIGPAGFDPRYQTLAPNGAIYQSRAVFNYQHLGRGFYRVTPPNYRFRYPVITPRGNIIYRPNFDRQYRYRIYRGNTIGR